MSNHAHQVLKSRPDIARTWDPETVARRWLSITPKRDRKTGEVLEPSPEEIQAIIDDPAQVESLRIRLSDVSWWMRFYSHHIAVRANKEDQTTGHFWEQRFKCEVLGDPQSILRCLLYVDLNPIRAGIASSIEDSDYTAAKDRWDDLRVHIATTAEGEIQLTLKLGSDCAGWERLDNQCSGWLSPIEIIQQDAEATTEPAAESESSPSATKRPRRVSQKGALQISLTKYLLLLDLVGREQRQGGSGFIPAEVSPILEQLNIDPTGFIESILLFGKRYRTANYDRPKEPVVPAKSNTDPAVAV